MAKFDLYKDGKVDQAGVESPIEITGLKPATQYDNYAVAYAGQSAKTELSFKTANQAVTGAKFANTTAEVEVGKTVSRTASVVPTNATDTSGTYESDHTDIATVDQSGKITGVAAGTATITFTSKDGGKTATCAVTVTEPTPDPAE